MKNLSQQNKLVESRRLAMALLLCSVKLGFTTLVNKRALHIIYYNPCILHRHALARKAFPEYLKIVLSGHGVVFLCAL